MPSRARQAIQQTSAHYRRHALAPHSAGCPAPQSPGQGARHPSRLARVPSATWFPTTSSRKHSACDVPCTRRIVVPATTHLGRPAGSPRRTQRRYAGQAHTGKRRTSSPRQQLRAEGPLVRGPSQQNYTSHARQQLRAQALNSFINSNFVIAPCLDMQFISSDSAFMHDINGGAADSIQAPGCASAHGMSSTQLCLDWFEPTASMFSHGSRSLCAWT